jgi:two-component system sensor histidine kinase KdpD
MICSSQRRRRHKVFVGMAPAGVNCRMLQEGRERLRDGSDVVIGLLETHGRREIARQAEGLEQVPPIRLRHRGVELGELDVAAVLERRPQLVLVDELARSNAPGNEWAKRWCANASPTGCWRERSIPPARWSRPWPATSSAPT